MADLSPHHEEPGRGSQNPPGSPDGDSERVADGASDVASDHARAGAEQVEEQAPTSVLQIVPGPYKAPMSIRAAARFAQGGGLAHLGLGPMRGFGQPRGSRIVVVALVGLALVAAGGVGTALAFRFGGGHRPHHHDEAPAELQPASDGTQP